MNKREQVSVAIDEDVYARLRAIAEAEHRSIKGQIAVLVERWYSPVTIDEAKMRARRQVPS